MRGCADRRTLIAVFAVVVSLPFIVFAADICPDSVSELSMAEAETPTRAHRVDWIVPGETATDRSSNMVVDVRSAAVRQGTRIPAALEMNFLQLRSVVGQSSDEIVVVGAGYDDRQLERRIGSWPETSGKVRIVRGGVAAWILSGSEPASDVVLEDVLGVPASRVAGLVMQTDWTIVALGLDEAGRLSAGNLLSGSTVLPVLDSESPSALAGRLQDVGFDAHQGLLVVGGDGQQSASVAVKLSRMLERPVFYAQGGATAVEKEALRFSDINRQPASLNRGCR